MAKSNRRSELEAQFVAAFVSLGCLLFFVLIARPQKEPPRKISSVPFATPQPSIEQPAHLIDPNRQFRRVPDSWASVDFQHQSYGIYELSAGIKTNLILKNGEYEYDFPERDRGWFSLKDVFYVDVTGDQIPEAIVNLSHVQCGGGSCDGGSDLFFIYSINYQRKLKKLLQYETGSYGYGCGLKSLTLKDEEVRLELFGRCPEPGKDNPGPGKFMVKDVTQLVFLYTDKGFIAPGPKFISTDLQDVRNYRPEVHINE